jgi:DNA-binding response OmpR family regulator
MSGEVAKGLRVLVLEDEFIIADEIATMLDDAGHKVIGPVATVADAMALIADGESIDAAVIDANLRGVSSAPIATELRSRGVPFCVCTGYRLTDLQKTFGEVLILQKPITERGLISALASLTRA